MTFLSSLIGITITGVIGGGIGMGCAKLTSSLLKIQDKKKVYDFIDGKTPNNLKLDGETINVDTFITKTNDGKTVKVEISDMKKKTPPEALNQVKKPLVDRLLTKFWKKRESKKNKKK